MKRIIYLVLIGMLVGAVACDLLPTPEPDEPEVTEPVVNVYERDDTLTVECVDLSQVDTVKEKRLYAKSQLRSLIPDTATLRIPVVVHILYTSADPKSNISDAQVKSGLALVNKQWAGQWPAGIAGTPSTNMNIEFVLAKRDPQNKPTTGIEHVDVSGIPLFAAEGIKPPSTGTKGADDLTVKNTCRWPVDKYVNIYIVPEIGNNNGSGGTIGYTYFFNQGGGQGGAVIQHTAFGCKDLNKDGIVDIGSNTFSSVLSYQNAPTHELGHWAWLYHTFQGNSCTETSCTTQGDLVCDTGPCKKNSACIEACPGEPRTNFMSYNAYVCQSSFSDGQRTRARNALKTFGQSYLTSSGLSAPYSLEASIVINSSGPTTCKSVLQGLTAKVSNNGSTIITTIEINNIPVPVTITPGNSIDVAIPDFSMPNIGTYSIIASIGKVNGQIDQFPGNNSASSSIEKIVGRDMTVTVKTDHYGSDLSWFITNSSGVQVASQAGFANFTCGNVYPYPFCLPAGTYKFTAKDTKGDDLSFTSACGGYIELRQGGTILKTLGNCWCPLTPRTQSNGIIVYECKACNETSFYFFVQ